jgi:hypothetical protein
VIGGSVGTGGRNTASDVRTIQEALNRIPASNGGPVPLLAVDGIVGPLTTAAIRRFQTPHVGFADGRVDPAGQTLAHLNGELDAQPADVAVGAVPASDFQDPDPLVIQMVQVHIGAVREVIFRASFYLAAAAPYISSQGVSKPDGRLFRNAQLALDMLEAAFSLSKLRDPLSAYDNIRRVFNNMNVAMHRMLDTDPLVAKTIFVPNRHRQMETQAAAYTHRGGAYKTADELLEIVEEPVDRIYICRNLLRAPVDAQIATLVHELAHFVSGQPIEVVDKVRNGHMLLLKDRPRFNKIPPQDKVQSAEHYAYFGMVARTPRYLKEGI